MSLVPSLSFSMFVVVVIVYPAASLSCSRPLVIFSHTTHSHSHLHTHTNSKSQRAIEKRDPIKQLLLVTRYQPDRVATHNMLSIKDISDMLGVPVVGVVPESPDVLSNTNIGQPVIMGQGDAAAAYSHMV